MLNVIDNVYSVYVFYYCWILIWKKDVYVIIFVFLVINFIRENKGLKVMGCLFRDIEDEGKRCLV